MFTSLLFPSASSLSADEETKLEGHHLVAIRDVSSAAWRVPRVPVVISTPRRSGA